MADFTRGSNPVWLLDDLVGNLLDDTYYLFVLDNTIPYNYATVYSDVNGAVPLANPIQFEANGTLTPNLFFNPDVVYRLEVRAGNTQSDTLIYLIEDYSPNSGGGSITSASITSNNQMTNTQFSLVNFETSIEITSSGDYSVAPGWDLVLTGSGTATVTREALNSSDPNPTNAPYMLRMALVGWTTAYLRQRFDQNGMLWANKYVSTSLTTKLVGSNANISASLFDSNAKELGVILPSNTVVDSSYTQKTGVVLLDASTNSTPPASAYIEYRLNLPGSIDIFVSSFQLTSSDTNIKYTYEQDTIQRQIDQTYHTAHPIVPIGSVINYLGFGIPDHYLNCNGDAISRFTYRQLFSVLTNTETVTLTSGVATFTVASSADYWIGMALEGDGVQASTTVSGIAGTTITMSQNADDSGDFAVTFFAVGAGDGSTTFNLPNAEDYVIAGVGGSLFGTTLNGIGYRGGASTHELTITEMPSHNHSGSTVAIGQTGTGASGSGISGTNNGPTAVTVAAQGGGTLNVKGDPHTIVQQTMLARTLIRFE